MALRELVLALNEQVIQEAASGQAKAVFYPLQKVKFEPTGSGDAQPGSASTGAVLGAEGGKSLGATLARFDGRSIDWTLRFDEIVVGIEGVATVTVGDTVHEIRPGDQMWLEKGLSVTYGGKKALIATIAAIARGP